MFTQPRHQFPLRVGDQLLITLEGEIDLGVRAQLAGTLEHVATLSPQDITVDLSAVSFLASEGLAFLVGLHNHVRDTGHQVILHAPGPAVIRVLHISGFDTVFTIEPAA